MKRIAIIGGGISGLTAAYELELARKRGADLDWQLYEATDRLGGVIETTRIDTPEGRYVLEGGPDGWVSEKPWATELALELGLEDQLIYSNDATRKTYIFKDGALQTVPESMRMMVPTDLAALDASPLFSAAAKQAYADEPRRADALRASIPPHDESVAGFVLRHFGEEVLNTLAAPLLGGVFGGDVRKLSVRAVMPSFVAMEREHGSLITALQAKQRDGRTKPVFTSLRNGMGSLVDALIEQLPPERIHRCMPMHDLRQVQGHIVLATSVDATRALLKPMDAHSASLLPTDASSAVLATFVWPSTIANSFALPTGFGFLVPHGNSPEQLLACTFVDQKFPGRAPNGCRVVRAFFGGTAAATLASCSDTHIADAALHQLRQILGPLPPTQAAFTQVRRWPHSLPQYEVGHLDRMAQLEERVARFGNLTLLGNSYRGVGVPDLVRDARRAVRTLATAP